MEASTVWTIAQLGIAVLFSVIYLFLMWLRGVLKDYSRFGKIFNLFFTGAGLVAGIKVTAYGFTEEFIFAVADFGLDIITLTASGMSLVFVAIVATNTTFSEIWNFDPSGGDSASAT